MPISFSSHSARDVRARGAGVTAVLGPTNTGKTHLAIERMLAHSSGMIGLPLRLLAREVYNKCVERVGADSVALVTGEEKIKPYNPRFWVSTIEAMPRDLDVAFVAIDEIQLAADLERGHVFTDRMLNRRGREETLVLGAATMRDMVEKLLPGANILSRPRLSTLNFAGEKKLTRLPRRTAIVAFSAAEVYEIAELIRRQRGGAAVVLGSLSPRTRNAQVALYQSGDVDYLVATDAIGMGLNLDVDHVAFAADRKFDGYQFRKLNPSELAQIAGRAGRATRDGTFGTTGRCPPFEPELAQALESHTFDSVKVLQWRNTALDFASLGALAASLAEVPGEQGLTRAPIAEDIQVLEHVSRDEDARALATSRAAIERLWEVCQVPDYRKISPAAHAELAVTLYGFLMREGTIPPEWFAGQVAQADRTDGDIDTLANRIAHIRTWTFAANRPDWLADPEHWQGITRGVEDKLSDALHERLAERFVDRRTSVLMRRLRENTMLETEITKSGEVVVEGHPIGRLAGFQFAAESASAGPEGKALRAAAQKALAGEIEARANRLSHAADDQIVLSSDGSLRWHGEPVGKLTAGDEVLRPRVRILSDDHLSGPSRDAVQARLDLWLKAHMERLLGPLFALVHRRRHHRDRARRRVPAHRGARRAGARPRRRGRERARSARARGAAQIRRALRRLSFVSAEFAQARPARARDAALGAEGSHARDQGPDRRAASRIVRPHLVPGRQGCAEGALSRGRLSRVRRARGARRYPGAAGRPDPSGARLAARLAGAKAAGRDRGRRVHRHGEHDVADRHVGRGFRLGAALARLSHGEEAEAGRGAGGSGASRCRGAASAEVTRLRSRRLRRSASRRLRSLRPKPRRRYAPADAAPETPVEAGAAPVAEAVAEPAAAPAEPSAAIEAAAETPVEAGIAPVAPEVACGACRREPKPRRRRLKRNPPSPR